MEKERQKNSLIDISKKAVQAATFAAVASIATQFLLPTEAQAAPQQQPEVSNTEVSKDLADIINFYRSVGGVDLLGKFLTTSYTNSAGGISVITEKAEIQKNPVTGTIIFGDILDDLSKKGLDKKLEADLQIPPKTKSQQPFLDPIKPDVQNYLDIFKQSGNAGSPVASKNYSDVLKVYRTPAVAVQSWNKDGVKLVNIGSIALKTNEVPLEAILKAPTDFSNLYIAPLSNNFRAEDAIAFFGNHTGIGYTRSANLMECESSKDPNAKNPTSDATGPWQLLGHNDLFVKHGWDPETGKRDFYMSTVIATEVFDDAQRRTGYGLQPWSCQA